LIILFSFLIIYENNIIITTFYNIFKNKLQGVYKFIIVDISYYSNSIISIN